MLYLRYYAAAIVMVPATTVISYIVPAGLTMIQVPGPLIEDEAAEMVVSLAILIKYPPR